MTKWNQYYLRTKHCRWCQTEYKAHIPVDRDGFCSNICKMAFYRAYKKYKKSVTNKKAGRFEAGSLATKLSNALKGG